MEPLTEGLSYRKKLFFSLALPIILLVFVEGGLQILSLIYKPKNAINSIEILPRAKIILCIGESTTAWGENESYPSILQKRLDQLYGANYFQVINAGVAGTNSRNILANLKDLLNEFQPTFVITMVGINDTWAINDNESIFKDFKVFKFLQIAKVNFLRLKSRISKQYVKNKLSKIYLKLLFSKKATSEDQFQSKLFEADLAFEHGQIERAISLTDEIPAEVRPAYVWSNRIMGFISLQNFKKAKVEITEYSILLEEKEQLWLWVNFIEAQTKLKMYDEAAENCRLALQSFPANAVLKRLRLKALRAVNKTDESLSDYGPQNYEEYPETIKNYRAISSLIADSGAVHLAMQYPLHKDLALKKILSDIPDIVYIDNFQNFESALQIYTSQDLFKDLFAETFGHLTKKGNEILVISLIETLKTLVH